MRLQPFNCGLFTKFHELVMMEIIDADKSKDFAIVCALLLLGGFSLTKQFILLLLMAILLLASLLVPSFFPPLLRPWLAISRIIGEMVTAIVLTAVFILLVTPIGLIRRVIVSDVSIFRSWRAGTKTAFIDRKHCYSSDDIVKTY